MDGVQIVLQDGHTSGISAVAVSPDGRYIASGDYSGSVKLWDVASGKETRSFLSETGAFSLRFSPDGNRLLMGPAGDTLVFEAQSGRQLTTEPLITSDGLIGVTQDRARAAPSLQVVNIGSGGQPIAVLPTVGERAIALSADGTMLLTWGIGKKLFSLNLDGEYIVWDLKARQTVYRVPALSVTGEPVLNPDGRSLLVENRDGSIDACEVRGGAKHRIAAADSLKNHLIASFVVSEDGHRLARATTSGAVEIYDLPGGAKIQTLPGEPQQPRSGSLTGSLFFSHDAERLAREEGSDGFVVWDLGSGKTLARLTAQSLAFESNGRAVVLGRSNGGAPVIHDLAGQSETALAGGAAGVPELDVSADGRYVVAGSHYGGARLWDLGTGELLRTFDCPGGTPATAVAVDRQAPLVATGCIDGSAWLFELKGSAPPRPLNPPSGKLGSLLKVRFSDDGRVVVVAMDETLSVWNVASGMKIRDITMPRDPQLARQANSMFSGFGAIDPKTRAQLPQRAREALEAAEQGAANIDARTRELMANSPYMLLAMAVSPDGHQVAVGTEAQISLWSLDTGQRLRVFRLATPGAPAGGKATRVVTDPDELAEVLASGHAGARSLAFSPDGSVLFADSARWDVATGARIARTPSARQTGNFDPTEFMRAEFEESGSVLALAVSPDRHLTARGVGRVVRLANATTGEDVGDLVGHTAEVQSVVFSADGRFLLSGAADGSLRLWKMQDRHEVVALFALGALDFVAVTPDQYYRASKSRLQGVSFRVNRQVYPFEQFDLRFNRPDIVLERLGRMPPETISSYRVAYQRRLKKSGFTEAMLSADFHLPEVELVGGLPPVSTEASTLTLRVRSKDDKYLLDRLSVFINDVPVFGTAGLSVREAATHLDERSIQVPLVPGRNKIQVSALNQQGAESLSQTLYTTSTAAVAPSDVYVVAIGVSEYQNSRYDLRFAAKDATDVMNVYRSIETRTGAHGQVHVLDLTNAKATRSGIRGAHEWLKSARSNDLVIVFAAGHGMTDPQRNYYFGTYDIDPAQPQINGLPYEEFEALLDGIPALQKVLLLDTCFSGEIEKEDLVQVQVAAAQSDASTDGTVSMRAFKATRGVTLVADTVLSGTTSGGTTSGVGGPALSSTASTIDPEVLRFQQDLFADLRRGTGAVVISSASGNEYALEGDKWRNGVFTYALLSGLRDGKADANHDGSVTVGELQSYVINEVRGLTAGGQNPTVRRENLDYDFGVF